MPPPVPDPAPADKEQMTVTPASWLSAAPLPGQGNQRPAAVPADELLCVTIDDEHPRATVVTVRGEVDMHTVGRLDEALHRVAARRPNAVVLDLEQVEFFSSSGLTTLMELRGAAALRGFPVCLAGAPRAVLRPLTAAGLATLFEQFPSVARALSELPEPRRPEDV